MMRVLLYREPRPSPCRVIGAHVTMGMVVVTVTVMVVLFTNIVAATLSRLTAESTLASTRKIRGFLYITMLCGFLTVFLAYRNSAVHSCRTADVVGSRVVTYCVIEQYGSFPS